jgi:flagellar hook assembly protein FlgD
VTTISFQIPVNSFVSLKIYDQLGQDVATLVNGHQSIGNHTVRFDGSSMTSGLYYYRIVAQNFTDIKKMVLIK